jgi:hypothetical protein
MQNQFPSLLESLLHKAVEKFNFRIDCHDLLIELFLTSSVEIRHSICITSARVRFPEISNRNPEINRQNLLGATVEQAI